jgi:transcriptional regulator with XRE-family HTH domain
VRVEEYVGQRIRARRDELGLTQEEFGRRLGELLGRPWSRSTVSVAENGRRAFTAAELVAIASVLETSPAGLLTPPPGESEVELPGGARLDTRGMTDFGAATKMLHDTLEDVAQRLYYEGASLRSLAYVIGEGHVRMEDPDGANEQSGEASGER